MEFIMGNSATKAKNKYNTNNYDRIGLMLPKGMGDLWKEEAKRRNTSLNALVQEAMKAYISHKQENCTDTEKLCKN